MARAVALAFAVCGAMAAATAAVTLLQIRESMRRKPQGRQSDRVNAAYFALRKAASRYHHAVSQLEVGRLEPGKVASAERLLIESKPYLDYLPDDKKQVWYDFWQCGKNMSERSDQKGHDQSFERNRKIWEENSVRFTSLFFALNEAARLE